MFEDVKLYKKNFKIVHIMFAKLWAINYFKNYIKFKEIMFGS